MTNATIEGRREYTRTPSDYGPFECVVDWSYLGADMQVTIRYLITELTEPEIQIQTMTMRQLSNGSLGQPEKVGRLDREILGNKTVLDAFTAHAEKTAKKIMKGL